jgi:hypothetical protein
MRELELDECDAAPEATEMVLVVEGAARAVAAVPGVRVVSASGSGDDAIVAVVGEPSHGVPRRFTRP